MKLIKNLVAAFALSFLAIPMSLNTSVSAAAVPAQNTNTATCSIAFVGTTDDQGKSTSKFTNNGNSTVSATLVVKGDSNCQQTISVASWRAPYGINGFAPLVKQTLLNSSTTTYGVGSHTLTVKVADCMYQVDVTHGTNPTVNGTPVYGSTLFGWVQAGTTVCEPAPVTPVVPVTPATPTPVVPVQPAAPVEPTVLPNTGAGNTIALFGAVTIAAAFTHRAFMRRRLAADRA